MVAVSLRCLPCRTAAKLKIDRFMGSRWAFPPFNLVQDAAAITSATTCRASPRDSKCAAQGSQNYLMKGGLKKSEPFNHLTRTCDRPESDEGSLYGDTERHCGYSRLVKFTLRLCSSLLSLLFQNQDAPRKGEEWFNNIKNSPFDSGRILLICYCHVLLVIKSDYFEDHAWCRFAWM